MPTFPSARSRPTRRLVTATGIAIACLTSAVSGVERDKAVYIGGTLSDFPQGARTADRLNVEGRIDTESGSEFVFDAGTRGAITIRYGAIVSLTFGRREPFGRYDTREQRGTRVFPKDFYSKDHYLLTIVYQDQRDTEHVVVLWLGNEIVRPTLATLEGRSGKATRFADAQGCAQYRTPEECGYAGPGGLKGIKRVFLDTGGDIHGRDVIVSEIQRAKLDVEVSERADDADVILNFRAYRRMMGGNLGIGEILVRQDRLRLVREFADSGRSEKAVTTGFARTFVEAYKKDNQLR